MSVFDALAYKHVIEITCMKVQHTLYLAPRLVSKRTGLVFMEVKGHYSFEKVKILILITITSQSTTLRNSYLIYGTGLLIGGLLSGKKGYKVI